MWSKGDVFFAALGGLLLAAMTWFMLAGEPLAALPFALLGGVCFGRIRLGRKG